MSIELATSAGRSTLYLHCWKPPFQPAEWVLGHRLSRSRFVQHGWCGGSVSASSALKPAGNDQI